VSAIKQKPAEKKFGNKKEYPWYYTMPVRNLIYVKPAFCVEGAGSASKIIERMLGNEPFMCWVAESTHTCIVRGLNKNFGIVFANSI
jgi:hypothetical protein